MSKRMTESQIVAILVAAEMILLALGMSADQAQQIAARPLLSFDE